MTGSELPRAVGKLQALVRIATASYPDLDRVDAAAFDARSGILEA